MAIELTIGCATFDDPHAIDTLLDLLIHHREAMGRVELIVVDNAPHTRNGRDLKVRMEKMRDLAASVRYIESAAILGPAASWEMVFSEAQGESVLCLHSHCRLFPGAVAGLLEFYRGNPECADLITGPAIQDDLRLANAADDYDVPAIESAAFSCRKSAWVGFNPDFRGFGKYGDYLAEKFRQHGRRVRCLGILPSWHLSGHLHGVPYPKTVTDRVRNAMIACLELGQSVDALRAEYVEGVKPILPPETFARIHADPVAFPYSRPRGALTIDGPGTELLDLIKRLGIQEVPGCGCGGLASTMNGWGIAGCRERREEIITVLRKNASAWGWNIAPSDTEQEVAEAALSDETRAAIAPIEGEAKPIEPVGFLGKARVGMLAVAEGLVFKIDYSDPFPGILDEAIRRAEVKASRT